MAVVKPWESRLYDLLFSKMYSRDTSEGPSLTMPNGNVHTKEYTLLGMDKSYTPPANNFYSWLYNLDSDWKQSKLPGGRTIDAGYDAGGRPTGLVYPEARETGGRVYKFYKNQSFGIVAMDSHLKERAVARPLRIEYPGAFYHVTSRGNERKDVFKTLRDREQFLHYLQSATTRYGAVVHVWCQLNNHYHLLIETPRGNLSEIMHHINGTYTTYYNVKRKRSGHLFQGRFKAILVEAEEYAKELSRYIHLNPVRAGIVERPEEYQWSSYRSYIGEENCPKWLETDFIHGYFGNSPSVAEENYRVFVEDALGHESENPLDKVVASSILGTEDFTDTIIATYVNSEEEDCNIPALRQLSVPQPLEEIIKTVDTVFDENKKQARQAGIYICHRYSGASLRDIGRVFGLWMTIGRF